MITADYTTILQCAVTSHEGIKQQRLGGREKENHDCGFERLVILSDPLK